MKNIDHLMKMVEETGWGDLSRQQFLKWAGRGLAAGIVGTAAACKTQQTAVRTTASTSVGSVPTNPAQSPPAKVPDKPTEPVQLEDWKAKTERQAPPPPAPMPPDQRVGFALVGLGHLTLEELLPAFAECKKARVTALVSGNPEKMRLVAQQYGIKPESCYSYETYDRLRDNPDVQVIYIVLPNGMHAEYTIRGAQAGKHILCEKPMANTAQECRQMIDACAKAGRKLMIAYRIQYEPHNRLVREMVQKKEFGVVKSISANNGQNSANPAHWRHKKALAGGGSLPDVGLYCLNTIRYVLAEEPTEVFGYIYSTPGDSRFREVEEQVNWIMKFPSGILANCMTGYGHHEDRHYKIMAEKGWIKMEPAFAYNGLQLETGYAEGKEERVEQHKAGEKNQFALEIDHMAECVLDNKQPFTPGEEGLQDQLVMEAIYRSAQDGRPVKLPEVAKKDAFRGPQPKES